MKSKANLDYAVIGKRIKELRRKKRLTQAKLAEMADIDSAYISHIERGVTKLSLPTLISIVNALGTTLDEVVYTNLDKSSHISHGMINELLADCTPDEISSMVEVMISVKKVLRRKR